jgi:HK97 family phage major capsid protein
VALTGYELAKLFSLSTATAAMSIGAFEEYLVQELGRAMRDALSTAIISGDGVGEPTGIIPGIVWGAGNSVSYVDIPEIGDLTKAMRLLPSNYRQNAVWSCNSAYFYDVLAPLADANGHPIFSRDLSSGAPLSLLGKPVIIDDFMSDNTLLFADPAYYFLNFSSHIAITKSTEAGFAYGTVLYRSMAVVDGKPVATGAFVKVTKA